MIEHPSFQGFLSDSTDAQIVRKWDVLFFNGDWAPNKVAVRERFPRLTMLRRRYFSATEFAYKVKQSRFCIYASFFKNPATEEAALIAAAGCPVVVDAKYHEQCPFAIPVASAAPRSAGDVFSDSIATLTAIEVALMMKRDDVRRKAIEFLAKHDIAFPTIVQDDPALADAAYWNDDWNEAMVWSAYKLRNV